MFFVLFGYKNTNPPWFYLLRNSFYVEEIFQNMITFFAWVNLNTRTTGLLPYKSIPIRINNSPVTCLLCGLPGRSGCLSCLGSVNAGSSFFSSVDGNWYLNFSPEIKHAVNVLHLFSISFLTPDHQSLLLSANIVVKSGWLKYSAFTICRFSSRRITIFSPANNKRKHLLS